MSSEGALATTDSSVPCQLAGGDPTWLGWLAVVAYVVAAGLCVRAARAPRDTEHAEPGQRRLAYFWLLLAVLLLALGVNKQLDLQTLFGRTMRDLAHAQGWYGDRRRFQRAFVSVASVVSLAGLSALAVGLWPMRRRVWLALFGLATLLVFVLLRAALFQHVGPAWVTRSEPLHTWLELFGVGVLGWAASRARPRPVEAP